METMKPFSSLSSLHLHLHLHLCNQNGPRKDRDQAHRELNESTGHFLEAPKWDHQESKRNKHPLRIPDFHDYHLQLWQNLRLLQPQYINLSAQIDRIKKENDNMQIELRHLKGEDLNSLNPGELIPIEEALQNGLDSVRAKEMDLLKMLKKNERLLVEENKRLTYILHQQQLAMEGNARELDAGFHEREREFASYMPMAFRVQPIQPNLHENPIV